MSVGFGERLAYARKRKGLTQVELGTLTSYSGAYISRLESERDGSPPLDTVIRLAGALDVTVGFLAGETCAVAGAGGAAIAELFAEHIRSLSPEAQTQLAVADLEVRFAAAVRWLCDRFPTLFTTATLAYSLGLSRLDAILAGQAEEGLSGPLAVQKLSELSGIPLEYFAGVFDQMSPPPQECTGYDQAVQKAVMAGFGPEKLAKLFDLIRGLRDGHEAAALLDFVQ